MCLLNFTAWKQGKYLDEGPLNGMRIARKFGMIAYRSREEFDTRFKWEPVKQGMQKYLV